MKRATFAHHPRTLKRAAIHHDRERSTTWRVLRVIEPRKVVRVFVDGAAEFIDRVLRLKFVASPARRARARAGGRVVGRAGRRSQDGRTALAVRAAVDQAKTTAATRD